MVGWHHWLYGHKFEQAPGVGGGQGILACCSLWGHKNSGMTEWLNWIEPFSSSKWSVIVSPSQFHRKNCKSKLMYFPCHFTAVDSKKWKQWQILFSWAPKSLQMLTATMKLKDTPWKKSYDQPRQYIKNQRHYFANKGLSGQSCGFSSHHIWMWELDCKESWASKNWCCWTVVLEKTLESPLDCKEIQPVHPRGKLSLIFIGRTDAEAETPILWPSDAKN